MAEIRVLLARLEQVARIDCIHWPRPNHEEYTVYWFARTGKAIQYQRSSTGRALETAVDVATREASALLASQNASVQRASKQDPSRPPDA